jgi:hypothetical protein
MDRYLIELAVSGGLGPPSQSQTLSSAEITAIKALPQDTRTVLKNLGIEPQLTYLICCPACFAMYPDDFTAPKNCTQRLLPSVSDESDSGLPDEEENQDQPPVREDKWLCGAELFKPSNACFKGLPIRRYAFQSLTDWLAHLFNREGIEEALDQTALKSRLPYNDQRDMTDIHDSRGWRELVGIDGQQFTASSNNITFGMFTDGINPYGNRQAGKHASVTFIIMVCLSLPVSLRYQPENIFLAGIAPGPHEPSLEQINCILTPVVEQLKTLWNPGVFLSQTIQQPQGRLISAALLPFFADLPALRRSLGFAGPTAKRMCSYCLLPKSDINNISVESWPMRTLDDHRHWAEKSRDAATADEKKKILSDHGVRYSVMLELPYWNILKNHVVDSMHNLLLGLLKWQLQRFWLMADVDDEEDPKSVSKAERKNLEKDAKKSVESRRESLPSPDVDESEVFLNILLGSVTDPSDVDFEPSGGTHEWGGEWVPPSAGKVIFDRPVLAHVNRCLKRICIPTWIKRAVPVLGKASFGRLKADEWRNLFTIQLPLIMPFIWNDNHSASESLLHNFAHLVSLVNLATKRTMNTEHVRKYRHHIHEYIKSCIILFPDTKLAPNHHMAFHLADCLDWLGPSRAWWSFSMERLMAQVLKSTGNNRLGLCPTCHVCHHQAGTYQELTFQL